ncbi:hypothetical protein PWT90_01582 [Aphanocladium album]|nr:hypothetical protein PWT90_01582 [Aphanocladium album]
MRLLLIRHGETVDNVAGNFAGVTDSALTAHGVLQAERLAAHLAARFSSSSSSAAAAAVVRGLFTSDLQRAARTGAAVQAACGSPPLVQTALLRERDFGSLEGVSFRTNKVDIEDVAESHASVKARARQFVDEMLLPRLTCSAADGVYIVVAHGILLPQVYAVLAEKTAARGGLTIDASVVKRPGGAVPLQPWWTNTAYLECVLAGGSSGAAGLSMHVLAVNCTTHLQDLKRTRGGIGSAAHDDKQKKIESYFGGKKL